MLYKPLDIKQAPRTEFKISTMPRKGINKADTSQLMNLDYALEINNYIPKRYGLEKRQGLNNIFERTGANPITLLKKFTSDVWIIGYSTKIEAYNTATSTWYTIKSDFTANGFDGVRYGDYFFTCNEVEKIHRISQTLAYDAQTGNFTVGDIVTGGTSGATAVILEDSDGGATGTLTLGNISGTFQNDEAITDPDGGAAVVNGTLTYTATEVTNSPVCGGLKVIGPRLYAYRLKGDQSACQYSEVDDGSNPPFTAWSNSTAVDDGGVARYRNAGAARAVVQNGPYTVIFSDNGFYAFNIRQLDSAGTLKKVEDIINYTEDYGGARGAIETPVGIFYANEAGLWQMVAVGQTDVPMSRQQILTSKLLGSDYFKDISQTSLDIVHDINQNCILVTCAKNSAFNNLVIGYELDLGAFFTFSNWNINRWAKSGQDIYGSSSVKTTVYKCFDGYADDGLSISTKYKQEIPMASLFNANSLNGTYAAGLLSPSTELYIKTDIFNLKGDLQENKTNDKWSANTTGSSEGFEEFGSAAFGVVAFGGVYENSDTSGLIESFGGGSTRINNFQRLRIKIEGADKLKHILTWLSAKITTKNAIKRRNFVKQ